MNEQTELKRDPDGPSFIAGRIDDSNWLDVWALAEELEEQVLSGFYSNPEVAMEEVNRRLDRAAVLYNAEQS